LTYRGNIIRHNFLHHIVPYCSPNPTHGCRGLHIDGVSANLTIVGNIFYRIMGAISTCAPDTRMENNVFVNCVPGISQGNRSSILETKAGDKDIYTGVLAGEGGALTSFGHDTVRALKRLNYQQPPWSARYPQLLDILEEKNRPLGWPRHITIERNVSSQAGFLQIASGIREGNSIRNNWQRKVGRDPLLASIRQRDFAFRIGSPVYGAIGFEPIPVENIGLYKDALRASWPVQREVGKYYKPDGKRRQREAKE